MRHVPPKRPYFFFTRFYRKTPFLPTFTQWPPIFNKLLVTQRPWHIFVTQRPLIFSFNSQTSDNFRQKIKLSKNLDKFDEMLRNFWPFWPWKPLFLYVFHWKTPYFCAICHQRPLHLRCLVALVRHFDMWVPPPCVSYLFSVFFVPRYTLLAGSRSHTMKNTALSLVFSTNVVCVKTQQKHDSIKHHVNTKQ